MSGGCDALPGGRTLVVVHVPKTAGTSLRLVLERAFGDGLRKDYDDRPLQHSRWARRARAVRAALAQAGRPLDVPCVYGHFLACKYALARRTDFAIWLRDPVQRVISRYHHYLRAVAAGETAHARWGLVPGLTLEQFARLPQYRDTCAEYLWLFPLQRFAFVGLVETFDADLARFAARFGLSLSGADVRVNANPDRAGERYEVDPAAERLIRRMNPRDVALYERVLASR